MKTSSFGDMSWLFLARSVTRCKFVRLVKSLSQSPNLCWWRLVTSTVVITKHKLLDEYSVAAMNAMKLTSIIVIWGKNGQNGWSNI